MNSLSFEKRYLNYIHADRHVSLKIQSDAIHFISSYKYPLYFQLIKENVKIHFEERTLNKSYAHILKILTNKCFFLFEIFLLIWRLEFLVTNLRGSAAALIVVPRTENPLFRQGAAFMKAFRAIIDDLLKIPNKRPNHLLN